MKFYLGTHQPAWLARGLDVPLFVSHRRLAGRRTLPRATGSWALDSGGFTELSMHGTWRTSPYDYIRAVRRYADEIGQLDWAAPQDWMTEEHVLARTGGTVKSHQRRTVDNFIRLRSLEPELPIAAALQGQTAPTTSGAPTSTRPAASGLPNSRSSGSAAFAAASTPTRSSTSSAPSPPAVSACTASASRPPACDVSATPSAAATPSPGASAVATSPAAARATRAKRTACATPSNGTRTSPRGKPVVRRLGPDRAAAPTRPIRRKPAPQRPHEPDPDQPNGDSAHGRTRIHNPQPSRAWSPRAAPWRQAEPRKSDRCGYVPFAVCHGDPARVHARRSRAGALGARVLATPPGRSTHHSLHPHRSPRSLHRSGPQRHRRHREPTRAAPGTAART